MSAVDVQSNQTNSVSSDTGKNSARKKIWELPEKTLSLLFSLVFNSKEITRVMRFHPAAQDGKNVCELKALEDLTYMGIFSKAVGKQLDKKFKQELRQIQNCETISDLQALWQQSLTDGSFVNMMWPFLTHSAASESFQTQCYWDVLQLLITRSKLLDKSKTQVRELEARLNSSADRLKGASSIQEQRQNDQSQIQQLQNEMNLLKARLASYHDKAQHNDELGQRYKEASKALKKEQYLSERQREKIKKLEAQLHLSNEIVVNTEELLSSKDQAQTLNLENEASRSEQDGFNVCDNQWAKGLDGRSVLYVGGRTRQVARLRKMVEVHGGRFVHHDGGLHDGFSRLKEVVDCADLVLCPLNCISHNASGHIKKCCKQANKPLCFLRTSGVSAFNEGLKKAMESDGISLVS